jgi:hypothetical protein
MEGDFWGAIEPHRNNRGASADGRITNHVTILPWTRTHMARQDRVQSDRNAPGKANLSTMGVPAEEQTEVGIGRLLVDLRRVR